MNTQLSSLLVEGVSLMFLGMGAVFIFLTVLVLAMNGISRLAGMSSRDETKDRQSPRGVTPQPIAESDEIVAVISAAIHHYRAK